MIPKDVQIPGPRSRMQVLKAKIVGTSQSLVARHVWAIGVVLAIGTVVAAGLTLVDLRDRMLADAQDDAAIRGTVLREHADHYFQRLDLLLQEVAHRSQTLDVSTPELFNRRMGRETTGRFLAELAKKLPSTDAIGVIDASGVLFATPALAPPAPTNVADREYFQYVRDHAESGVYISAPVRTGRSGAPTIIAIRRISGPDGAFLGAVAIAVDTGDLLEFYKAVGADKRFAVALLRRDGVVLAREPAAGLIARAMPPESPWYARVAAGGGTYRSPGYLTSSKAIISVNPVPGLPLVVNVSIRESDALAAWSRQALYTTIGATLLAGALLALFHMIAQQMRRQQEQNAALSHSAQALRTSEARLRDYASLASDWFWEQDADLRFTEERHGTRPAHASGIEVVGKRRWEIADNSGDPVQWEQHRRDLLAHQTFRDFRYHRLVAGGRILHMSVSGVPVYDPSGAFVGYRGIGRDTTDQIEAEQSLRRAKDRAERAEALLQDAIDSIAEGFVIYDADDRLITCNEAFRRRRLSGMPQLAAGATFAEILRHGLAHGIYPDAIGHEQEWLDEWLKRHREPSGQAEQPLNDGTWLLMDNQRMRNGGSAGLCVDITDLKRTQAELKDSEARLDMAQEIAEIGSWELDIATGERIWSKQLYRMRGLPFDFEPSHASLAFSHSAGDAELFDEWIADLQAGRKRDPIEIVIIRADGTQRVNRMEGRQIVDSDGVVRRLVGTAQDITEQTHVERQLAQSQKMEAIGNLTGGIAHDFNNMLGVIIGNLELLMRLVKADAAAAELCRESLGGALRCTELIRNLLAFARRESLRPEPIDVNGRVTEMARLLERTLGQDIVLDLDLDATLWSATADPVQLETALVNLANNARDAMPAGGRLAIVTRNVHLDASYVASQTDVTPGDYALIEVSDTGTGMPPEIIGRIFEPFFTTKPPGMGTGLGLSMVFGFIKQTGGHVSAYSELEHGTTFRLYLPRSVNATAAPVVEADPGAVVGGTETILIVEDEEKLRRAAARLLAELGYHVREAESADEALAVLSGESRVDLLFTDVVMPGLMNGIGLARRAAVLRPELCILLTSGFSNLRNVGRQVIDNEFPLLNKPYLRDKLARTIRSLLDSAIARANDPAAGTTAPPG